MSGGIEAGALAAPALAFLVAAASPGPATLAVAATAMARGAGSALALGAGLALGLAFWGALTAAGLGAVVLASPPALTALKAVGGLYLLWLAWRSLRGALAPEPAPVAAPTGRLFRRGLLLNLANPKAALAWAAVIALGLPEDAGAAHLWAIAALCSALGLAIYAAYALGFSVEPARRVHARARRGIEATLAAAFGWTGARLLRDAAA